MSVFLFRIETFEAKQLQVLTLRLCIVFSQLHGHIWNKTRPTYRLVVYFPVRFRSILNYESQGTKLSTSRYILNVHQCATSWPSPPSSYFVICINQWCALPGFLFRSLDRLTFFCFGDGKNPRKRFFFLLIDCVRGN